MIQMTRAQLVNKVAYRIDPLLAASVEIIDSPFVGTRINGEFDVQEWRANRKRDKQLDSTIKRLRKRNHAER